VGEKEGQKALNELSAVGEGREKVLKGKSGAKHPAPAAKHGSQGRATLDRAHGRPDPTIRQDVRP